MHPLKRRYYLEKIIATVTLYDDGRYDVEGGRSDLNALKRAKRETHFCFVKDLRSRRIVRMILEDGRWIPERSL